MVRVLLFSGFFVLLADPVSGVVGNSQHKANAFK